MHAGGEGGKGSSLLRGVERVCVCVYVSCFIVTSVICRVGQGHTFIGIYGVLTVFLAGKLPYIPSYTVQIYGSGQPY